MVEKCSSGAEAVYLLKHVYRHHGTNQSFHKITASITGKPAIWSVYGHNFT